jgi:hypothetical protein
MEDLNRAISVEEAAKAAGVGRNSCKSTIRKALREVYDAARDNPPNVNRAWALLKLRVPDASRSRVREVLREEEFSGQRRQPGKRRFFSEAEIPAAELSNRE